MGLRPYDRKGDWILVARSEEFGQFVRDVMGMDSLREAERKCGLSTTYLNSMRNGLVPGPDALAQFATGYGLTDQYKERLLQLAGEVRSEINGETYVQLACILAGLSTSRRLAVLECFRTYQEEQETEEEAA